MKNSFCGGIKTGLSFIIDGMVIVMEHLCNNIKIRDGKRGMDDYVLMNDMYEDYVLMKRRLVEIRDKLKEEESFADN